MLTNKFTTVFVSEITIPEDRQRRKLENIEDLAASLRANGLMNPIVVTRDLVLIAGERRLTAAKSLGWEQITVHFAEDLPLAARLVLELEENIRRDELPWADRCAAVARYHTLRMEEDPEWSIARSADALGMSDTSIRDHLGVQRELERGTAPVTSAGNFSIARNIVRRKAQRAGLVAEQELRAAIVGAPEPEPDSAPAPPPLHHGDFRKWLKTYDGPPFNFIHCDFPYGINAHTHKLQNATVKLTYADTPEYYKELLGALPQIPLAESAHIMFWFSMHHYALTLLTLKDQGWTVNPFPLIWSKSDNSGILPDASLGPRRVYETALMASKGDRLIAQAKSNVWHGPPGNLIHPAAKPREMLRHFFTMFVDESTVMLDPTAGTGNAVRVATDMGGSAVGVELDEEFHKLSVAAWERDDI